MRNFFDEYKIASHNKAMLGISKPRLATIQFPFTYIALNYCQSLVDAYKESESRLEE